MNMVRGSFPVNSSVRCPFVFSARVELGWGFQFRHGEDLRFTALTELRIVEVHHLLACAVLSALEIDPRDAPYSVSSDGGYLLFRVSPPWSTTLVVQEGAALDEVLPLLKAGVRSAHEWLDSDQMLRLNDVPVGMAPTQTFSPQFYVPKPTIPAAP